MSSRPRHAEPRPTPRLYLVTPVLETASEFIGSLSAALSAGDVAAVLVRLAPNDERTLINHVKHLAPVVQERGAALILDGHVDIVARSGADGAHLTGIAEFTDALETLKPYHIAGAGGVTTHHDSMVAAEQDADYVMFGEPTTNGQRPTFEAVEEQIRWWAEVFETPCVGFATSLEEIKPLIVAGADFIAVGDFIWRDPQTIKSEVAAAFSLLCLPETIA